MRLFSRKMKSRLSLLQCYSMLCPVLTAHQSSLCFPSSFTQPENKQVSAKDGRKKKGQSPLPFSFFYLPWVAASIATVPGKGFLARRFEDVDFEEVTLLNLVPFP